MRNFDFVHQRGGTRSPTPRELDALEPILYQTCIDDEETLEDCNAKPVRGGFMLNLDENHETVQSFHDFQQFVVIRLPGTRQSSHAGLSHATSFY